jgi:malonate-semialdehyde dehydrogenase (acetylating)/methylmalonate-semialdehyde dehydrogenase
MQRITHLIGGDKVVGAGQQQLPIYNPATAEVTAEIAVATKQEIESAVSAAQRAFVSWSQVTPMRRARVLFKYKELLEKHTDELAKLVTAEHGKTIEDAKGSVLRAIELVEFHCGAPNLLKGSYSENVGTGVDSYTIRQPLGVCVGISPFNFPVMVPAWLAIPAIACGNTYILKPSEKDPSSALFTMELLQQAGLPAGVVNVVHGDQTVVEQLISHPQVQAVSAVASTPVAKSIYQTAIQHGKRAATFGGAKNHCVIMPDAPVDETVDALLGAAYGSAGERCMAVSVAVVVGDSMADKLVSELQRKVPELQIGPGDQAGVEIGPLVTAEHLQRVSDYIQLGVDEGAALIIDGRQATLPKSINSNGFFLGGCLFDKVQPNMRIYQEEIFGPVLCVVRVKDFEQAVELVNQHQFGNGTAIFTHDGDAARTFANRVQVGMVGINVPIPVPVAYHSFGGWKNSSFGDVGMHGGQSIQFYTKQKTITQRWPKGVRTGAEFVIPNL